MGNQLPTKANPIVALKNVLNADSVQAQFKNALGAHKDAFVASIIDLVSNDKQLQTCDPASLVKEALRAATMQLPLNKALGFAYILCYNNNVKRRDERGNDVWVKVPTPTFVPGYKGYIQLAMRTGQYKTLNADCVYEGELGKKDKLSGAISLDGEKVSDKIIGYFCYFELINGFSKTLYMSVEEMAAYAKRYAPSVGSSVSVEKLVEKANSPTLPKKVGWEGNFNDMAIKTVLRRLLSKYGYLSIEMQSAIAKDVEGESAAAERDAFVASNANAQIIDVDAIDVDKETGEIKEENPSDTGEETPY